MLFLLVSSNTANGENFDSFLQLPQSGSTRTRPKSKRVLFVGDFGAKGDRITDDSEGRYSVVGAQPTMEIVAKENKVTIMDREERCLTEEVIEDPMAIPRRISETWSPQLIDDLSDAFYGGSVGYFSYDTVRNVERRRLPFSKSPKDDRNLPDMHSGMYDDVIVFDHVEKRVYAIHWVRLDRCSSVEKAYTDGVRRLEKLVARVHDIDV